MVCMERDSFNKEHYTVLHNSTLVAPYIEEHKNIVHSNNPGKPGSWIRDEHMRTFGGWLQSHLMNDINVREQLYLLARAPSSTILTF